MPEGLPRKFKLAFTAQALIASVVLVALFVVTGIFVREAMLTQAARVEAKRFWNTHAAGTPEPSRGPTLNSYFMPAGGTAPEMPADAKTLRAGTTRTAFQHFYFVDERPQGRLVISVSSRLIDKTIFLTMLGALLIALGTSTVMVWQTYRLTKRMVVPVSWLANVVTDWDPRTPDTDVIRGDNLPADSGSEVRKLAGALTGLSDRITDFVRRERDFTRDASHELRTPLTVMRVATDLMLADPGASPRQQRSLHRMQRAGRDMEAVIDAFLILAREAEVEPLSEEFDVREVVAHEVARVQPMLVGRPIELEVVDEGAPRLFAPPHVLAVMIGNLLGNAVRFTDRGRIELRLAPERIEVRDSGIGMTPEALMKAFDPFYRVDHAREEGRGMGLSIVRRLGERFGWPVSLDSEPGRGTTAIIRFA